ncbi:response regulator [Nitrospina gracilis]|uniref:response regulator n=1 Tax=Nitrospina gracilis TaxID=35801 RepID=UPI001F02416F|nr:response regulator [Nitrospina gracilis]MCF8720933.1 signal transduction histidine kinase [Nitrospina gracilis Nb-211]
MNTDKNDDRPYILIVDDVEANLVALESLLEEEKCRIVRADSGKEALAKVLEHDFALILLDVQMPNMDGYEAASLIRGIEKTRYIPIIFITASSKEEPFVFKGYQRGAVDYLYKPLNPLILNSKVRVFLDLHKQKKLIQNQAKNLKGQVEEMEQLKNLADRANKAKSEFLSAMNHEIRTPLNAIFGYAQIMKLDEMNLTPRQRNGVEGIYRAGQHLMRLIDNVLDLAKIEAGRMTVDAQEFDLVEILLDITVMFESVCKTNNIDFFIEGLPMDQPCWVLGDDQKLRQVLINLIGNATKFTEKGGISLKVKHLGNCQFQFGVKDTGRGIPKEKQALIFEPFCQTELGQSKGGTGLGLAISKRFIELMGGQMKLISEENKGSCFYFTIPLQAAESKPKTHGIFETLRYKLPTGCSVRALIVDDIPDNVEVLSQLLIELGLDVRSAENGQEAIESATVWKPDIVFMDYQMPVMNGFEAAKEIRALYGDESVKIILLSASVLSHEKEDLLKENIHNGFLSKPFMQREIVTILEQLLDIKFDTQNV